MILSRLKVIPLVVIVFAFWVTVPASMAPITPFDRFGDINCEDEMARLDNLAIQLMHESSAKGLIIFYGGRRFRGRLPKRGEAAARAARLKPYLVQRRGVPADQVIVIDGGYSDEWNVVVWIVPAGATMLGPIPTVSEKEIKFRKGKANPRHYQCRV